MFMVGPAGGWRGCNQPIEYRMVLPLNIIGSPENAAGLAEESSSDSLGSADDGCSLQVRLSGVHELRANSGDLLHPSAPPPTCIRGTRPQPNGVVSVSQLGAAVQPDAAAQAPQPGPAGGVHPDAPPSLAAYTAQTVV